MQTEAPTAPIEMLDYSKPPQGFDPQNLERSLRMTVGTAGVWGPRALAAAWAHFKAHNDPPGCSIGLVMKGQGATTRGDFVVDWGALQVASVPAYKGKAQRAGAYQEARADRHLERRRRHFAGAARPSRSPGHGGPRAARAHCIRVDDVAAAIASGSHRLSTSATTAQGDRASTWGSSGSCASTAARRYRASSSFVRAAAWAWHDRRHELAGRMSAKPSHRRWYSKAPPDGDMGGACVVEVHRTAEAARRAVLAVLEDGSEGWPEDVEAVEWGELVPMAKAQEYNREETPEGEFDYMCEYRLAPVVPSIWPRCLTWTDEQVAEVEHWLRDSAAEMPEVLRSES